MKTLFINGTVVNGGGSQQAELMVENGKIAAVGTSLPRDNCEIYDAAGCLLFPGFIDAHTHLDMDTGTTVTCDDFASGTGGAVCCGTTTVVDFATQDKGGSLEQALEIWHRKADGNAYCDYGFHMAITDWSKDVSAEISLMTKAGVTSYKLYFAYDALRVNDREALEILEKTGAEGALVGTHCENGDAANYLTAKLLAAGKTAPQFHPKARPDSLESEAVNRFCTLGEIVGVPVHIVHLSSRKGLEQVRIARERGVRVLVETCPQYLCLDEKAYRLPDFEGAKYVCSPPLRRHFNQSALWNALRAEEIQTIATDHCSFLFHGQKDLGRDNFSKIPGGLPGLAYRPQLIYTGGVVQGRFDEAQFVRLMSENAARQFGMYPQKGTLLPGSDADIVVWNPNTTETLTAAKRLHKCDYTPYEGMEVTGTAQAVFLRGVKVAEHQTLCGTPKGCYVPRHGSFAPVKL